MKDKIKIGGYSIDIEVEKKNGSKLNIILAHGANNDMNNSLIQKLFDQFKPNYSVLRFNFSFVGHENVNMLEIKDGSLVKRSEEELRKCVEYMGARDIVLIGKSFGGYISVLLASRQDLGIKRVIAMGYPLHKPNNPSELIEGLSHSHLLAKKLPVDFIIGDSDPVWDVKQSKMLSTYNINVINNADHSFKPIKPGATQEENEKKIVEISKSILENIN